MKPLSSMQWFPKLMAVAVLAAVIKLSMMGVSLFLPMTGVDTVPYTPESIYDSYKPSSAFALAKTKATQTKKEEPVYKLDKLKLRAIFDHPTQPFIAVEDGNKVELISKDETYKGYKLVDVEPIRAIFEKDGRRYEIGFKEDEKDAGAITKATPEVVNEGEAVFIKRNEIKHYAKNYDDIWKNVKIQEIIKNKRLQGFDVTWVKKGSVFEKIGLRKGDIITGANGQTFKSLSQVFKLYNNVDEIDSLKLTILRDNQEMELEYEIFE